MKISLCSASSGKLWDVSCCPARPCHLRVLTELLSPTSEPASSCATLQSAMHIMTGQLPYTQSSIYLQGNALCKALMPCSLSSAEAGLSGQDLTYGVSLSKVLSSPYERQAFFQFTVFLRTLTLLHKSRLSLGLSFLYWDVVYFQSVSFLPAHFFFLTLEQQNSAFAQQPELQKVHPCYCRRAEFCPR